MTKIKHNAIQCLNCKDIIYSIARHDYHGCTCGECTIDGGFDYIKYGWAKEKPVLIEIEIDDLGKDGWYYKWAKSKPTDPPIGLIKYKAGDDNDK